MNTGTYTEPLTLEDWRIWQRFDVAAEVASRRADRAGHAVMIARTLAHLRGAYPAEIQVNVLELDR